MSLSLRSLGLAALVMATVACQESRAENTQLIKVPGDGSFRYAISDMVERVGPTIVSIQVEKKAAPSPQFDGGVNPFEFFFGPGFGPQMGPQPQKPQAEQSLGSGVIVSKDGYILTNNHVVEGADKITITLWDEKTYSAKIIGRDEATDLAVIKIDKKDVNNLPFAQWGESDSLRVGEWVVAIGNPFGLDHTVTTGIVSAKGIHGRGLNQYENFIQVDAAINPGNSGGALLNLEGKLVGINSAILSRSGGFQGIGFAIPVNMARKVMTELIEKGSVSRGWLGVGIQDLSEDLAKSMKLSGKKGALLTEIQAGSPAAKAGLAVGDLIVSLDGSAVKNTNELRNTIALTRPGSKLKLGLIRAGKEMEVEVLITTKDGKTASANQNPAVQSNDFGASGEMLSDAWRQKLNLEAGVQGLVLKQVQNGSAADQMGLEAGDVVLRINNTEIKSLDDYQKASAQLLKDKEGTLLIARGGGRMFLSASLP